MPAWIHNRAEHLLAKNPKMTKSQAFAIATQQSHKLGKSPKGYGTAEGKREAKRKMDKPKKAYVKGANPGDLDSPKLASVEFAAMSLELEKEAFGALKGMSYMGKRLAGGTALGAAGGAAAGAAAGGEGNRLKGALGGALGGAALGAGAGYVAPRMASHMRAGATLGQAAKGVGGDIAAGVRGAGRQAMAPVRRAQGDRAIAEASKMKNPTQHAAARFQESMKHVSPQARQAMQSSVTPAQMQQMRAMGMTDEAMAQLFQMGSKPGEAFATSAGRQAAEMASRRTVAGAPFLRSASDAVTGAASPLAKAAAAMALSDISPQSKAQRRAAASIGKLLKHYKEKKGSAGDDPYMLDKLHVEPKIRPFKAEAPEPKHRVKQAAKKGEREKDRSYRRAKQLAGGGLAGGVGSGLGFHHYLKQAPDADDARVYKKLVESSDIPVHGSEVLPEGQLRSAFKRNAALVPSGSVKGKKTMIVMGDQLKGKPGVLAHEMGHGTIHRNPVGRLVQNKLTTGLGRFIGGSMLAGGSIGALTGGAEDERVRKAGRWAPALAAAPMLAYEAGASALGLGKMRRAGASGKQLWKATKGLVPAWGTYAAPVALATGAAHAGQALTTDKGRRVKKEKEKKAFSESQYSGGTGWGPFQHYASQIPAFVSPPVKTAGPPSEDKDKKKVSSAGWTSDVERIAWTGTDKELLPHIKKTKDPGLLVDMSFRKDPKVRSALLANPHLPSMTRQRLQKTAAMSEEIAKLNAISTPAGQLGKTQRIGAPKASAPPGPSIHQVSKPVGFGRAQPGALKNTI